MISSDCKSGEPVFEVVWPLGRIASQAVEPAPAVLDLNGKTVCQMWDWLFRGDQIYSIISQELRRRYPEIRIIDHETMGNTHGTHGREYVDTLARRLQSYRADAVISAVGA